jgi:hypothetical protein
MIPLILSSPAESSRLTGTRAVNAKTISENEPPIKDLLEEIFYSYSFVIPIYRYLCHYLTLF